ncbi:hypothetical protein BDV97DRAFT_296297 [Delphinella strobiligena]|nr:hypothetical protein BDV97DRAFT_296297 [Delphinella strobiligena]
MTEQIKTRSWLYATESTSYLISTNTNLLSHSFIQSAFASSDMYWARPLSDSELSALLASSLNLETHNLEQIGFARFVTDHLTTFYLTDVYTAPEHRGKGLGKWLIACCKQIIKDAKHLRRAALMASPGEGKKFYEKELGMHDIAEDADKVLCMTLTSSWLLGS